MPESDPRVKRYEFTNPDAVRFVPTASRGCGILVVAGSSGRLDEERARIFATHGWIAESLRWFGGPGQHSTPWEIPLEIFLNRLDELSSECDRVYMVGTSFGSEAALLCGALSSDVSGVAAFAPSDVVWAGYDEQNRERSHWSLGGKPLPYVPFDWRDEAAEEQPRFRPLYERSRERAAAAVIEATIPVEDITKLLLVAGGDDQVWPSVSHAQNIARRRLERGLTTTTVSEPDAGHRTVLPGEPVVTGGTRMLRGGNEKADRQLGERAWAHLVTMFS